MKNFYDVVVIGGGHAGVEAAFASARMGAGTLLITIKPENLGEMSCNPSIGGVAKGIIVKEIDAFGGLMPQAIDKASIHSKILNESKGAAVHGPRAQADRLLYKQAINSILVNTKNLEILFASVEDLVIHSAKVCGVILQDGRTISTKSVIVTTGTFLNGLIHIGRKKISAGRIDEMPSVGLANSLKKCGFKLARLKTGTPPRLDGNTINWNALIAQPGDNPPKPFSVMTVKIQVPQINCYITHTNQTTHEIIKNNAHNSPMFLGEFEGRGPRYCPSIEDKISRFTHKSSHQVFLEPEGLNTNVIYPNGISTSLPEVAQESFVRSIYGLENVQILKYGYAIEYDYVLPFQLRPTLETKLINGLFLAGQINGTTGYEEAAGQGLIAGINAAYQQDFILDRSESYIGVMIDDLISFEINEPYRVLTSRSEYRLSLRADNADLRLSSKAMSLGLLSKAQVDSFAAKLKSLDEHRKLLQNLEVTPSKLNDNGISIAQDGIRRSAYKLLSYPNINLESLVKIWPELVALPEDIKQILLTEAKYQFYLSRQDYDIKLFKEYEALMIPRDVDYYKIDSLSNEVKEKLNLYKPLNIGSAGRIAGITPAAIIALIIFLRKNYAV